MLPRTSGDIFRKRLNLPPDRHEGDRRGSEEPALFGGLAVFTAVAHWNRTLTAVRLAVDFGLLAIVLISIAIGRLFTLQYARERVAKEYWQTPLFRAVNRRITWVWAAALGALVIAHAAVHRLLDRVYLLAPTA
jgi:hypothetical protein